MSGEKTKWEDIKFPVIRNVSPRLLSEEIEGIPTEDMPRRMAEMFASTFSNAVKTIEDELSKIRGVEGKEERVKYLEDLLAAWA